MNENKPAMIPRDLYQEATDHIIRALEAGTTPWQKPWTNVATGPIRNGATNTPYRGGVNNLLLACSAIDVPVMDSPVPSDSQSRSPSESSQKTMRSALGSVRSFSDPDIPCAPVPPAAPERSIPWGTAIRYL